MRFLLALLALLAPTVSAQTALPAGDINIDALPNSSFATPDGVMVGDVLYYRGYTLARGFEPWRTDGTAAGTYMIADLQQGPAGSTPHGFVELGGKVIFFATTPEFGEELWITDGTAAGTHLIRDIRPGRESSTGDVNPGFVPSPVAMGNHVYFGADDGVSGRELWRTNGTPAGTQLVADLKLGSAGGYPWFLTLAPSGAHLVFSADDGVFGRELYITDGSTNGTSMLVDINPGPESSDPRDFVALGNRVMFAAFHRVSGNELWATLGTPNGTFPIKDINPGTGHSNPKLLEGAILNGELYFEAKKLGIGEELWKTDGTPNGTVLVGDLLPGEVGSFIEHLTAAGGGLFFSGKLASGSGLWRMDGTTGAFEKISGHTSFWNLKASGSLLFFRSSSGNGIELWVSDGTKAGTHLVKDITPGKDGSGIGELYARASGGILFGAYAPGLGTEPWVSDGTSAGTHIILDAEPSISTADSNPEELTVIGGKELYFSADDGLIGRELYRWTKAGGVELVKDIAAGTKYGDPKSSDPWSFVQLVSGGVGTTYFLATPDGSDIKLWKTDGTPSGTSPVMDLEQSPSGYTTELTVALNRLFFVGWRAGFGHELWTSDGTSAGTHQLVDLTKGAKGSHPQEFTQLGDKVLFRATDASGDVELYVTDGTAERTHLLMDIGVGFSSEPHMLTRVGDQIAFVVNRDSSGEARDLWVTDGTVAGTQLVTQVGSAAHAGVKGEMVSWGDRLLFHGSNGPKQGLFISDLTAAGTVPLFAPNLLTETVNITPVGDKVYFQKYPSMYVLDGPSGMVNPLKGDAFWFASWQNCDVLPLDDGVLLAPDDSTSVGPNHELYFTNGKRKDSGLVVDVTPEYWGKLGTGSNVDQLSLVDGDLLFVAEQPFGVGREVFRIADAGGYVEDLGLSGSGHFITSGPALIGRTTTVFGSGAPPGTSFLAFSSGLSAPSTNLVVPGDVAWLDPAMSTVAAVTTTPSWSFTLSVPPIPALVGGEFALQSWTFYGGFPARTSNGLQFVIGQ